MRGRACRPKIIYIPRRGIDCAGKGPIHGGGVEIAAPGIENGCKYRRGHTEIDTRCCRSLEIK